MIRAGELPGRRAYLTAYLTEAREGLVNDLGPLEDDLTAAQIVLIDRVISKLSVLRCVEEYVLEKGVFTTAGELHPVLSKSYLAWANSIRLDLQALGIDKQAGERVLSPLEVAAEIDAENADREAERAAREAAGQGRETVAAQSPEDTKEDAGSPGGAPGSEIDGKDPGVAGEIVDPEATQAEIQHRGDEDNEKSDA